MEIYVISLFQQFLCMHFIRQQIYYCMDLYFTNTDENKNECKLIKNKLKTTKKSQHHALKSLQETLNWFMYHGVY